MSLINNTINYNIFQILFLGTSSLFILYHNKLQYNGICLTISEFINYKIVNNGQNTDDNPLTILNSRTHSLS